MKPVKIKYEGYELIYIFQPGSWMSDHDLALFKKDLDCVNHLSGKALTYGVFDPSLNFSEIRSFLEKSNFCLIKDKGEPVGFFYNLIMKEESPAIIHAGLILLAKNRGVDLIKIPYGLMAILHYKNYGKHYYSNICSTPSIIGIFSNMYSNVWPSHKANLIKPPNKYYYTVLDLLYSNYIKLYFPADGLEIDKKRFILRSKFPDLGIFETNIRKLPRYSKAEINVFCLYWIDYTKGEDMIQIGVVDWYCIQKIRFALLFHKLDLIKTKIFSYLSQKLIH
jgi:hypothetical protein